LVRLALIRAGRLEGVAQRLGMQSLRGEQRFCMMIKHAERRVDQIVVGDGATLAR